MELWDAYYPDATKAGVDLIRGQPVPPQYRHAVTEILVVHRDGTILLTQRDFQKPTIAGGRDCRLSMGGAIGVLGCTPKRTLPL